MDDKNACQRKNVNDSCDIQLRFGKQTHNSRDPHPGFDHARRQTWVNRQQMNGEICRRFIKISVMHFRIEFLASEHVMIAPKRSFDENIIYSWCIWILLYVFSMRCLIRSIVNCVRQFHININSSLFLTNKLTNALRIYANIEKSMYSCIIIYY